MTEQASQIPDNIGSPATRELINAAWGQPVGAQARDLADAFVQFARSAADTQSQADSMIESRQALIDTHQDTIQKLQRELSVVGERLLGEAEARDWCTEYDEFVESVNTFLGREVLQPCERDYSVHLNVYLTVRARGQQAASAQAGRLISVDGLEGVEVESVDPS